MDYTHYDNALEVLAGKGPEIESGAPNHGPMAAEALAALDRAGAITPWIQRYRSRLRDAPAPAMPIGADWPAALGERERVADWEALFLRELATTDWRCVLDHWLLRLVPGTMAAGTHGVIRVGHAVRALGDSPTQPRLHELARALAYCASRYRPFLKHPLLTGSRNIEQALHALPRLPGDVIRYGPPPKIVRALEDRADFPAAVDELAPPSNVFAACTALAQAGADLYLRNAGRHPLVLLHTITAPSAVQLVLPYISPASHSTLFAYLWQAIASWTSAYTFPDTQAPQAAAAPASWNTIIDDAVESDDEHCFKLTEACRRQELLSGAPIFRRVAADWVSRVLNSRAWPHEQRVHAGIEARLGAA